jgi:hypothetical protein
MGAAIDIVSHIVTLVPLEDHLTVSALSCACTAYRGLFSEFLRVNDIVDIRGLASDAEICWCDRMHGVITRTINSIEWAIVRYDLRAYIPRTIGIAFGRCLYTMMFSFGTLQSIRGHTLSYIRAAVAGIPVAVMICSPLGAHRSILLRLWSDMSGITIRSWHYRYPRWELQIQNDLSVFESDVDDVKTILAQDLDVFIKPYKKLARQHTWISLG